MTEREYKTFPTRWSPSLARGDYSLGDLDQAADALQSRAASWRQFDGRAMSRRKVPLASDPAALRREAIETLRENGFDDVANEMQDARAKRYMNEFGMGD